MPVDIVMPRLSDTMSEGTIARWLKKPGDQVKKGEALAEIETDKALMQYESFEDGVLGEIRVGEGQTVPLGETIALLYRPGEKPDASSGAAPADAPRSTPNKPADARSREVEGRPPRAGTEMGGFRVSEPGPERPTPRASARGDAESAENGGRVRSSPLARRIAAEHGIDLATLRGTGPGGRIVREDVEAVLERAGSDASGKSDQQAPRQPQPSGDLVPLTRMQSVVARRMVESKTQVPHIYLTVPIDMGPALRFRHEAIAFLGKDRGFSLNDLFVKATALTLQKHPVVNASFTSDGIQFHAEVNVGFAVALPRGLVVPVIRGADQKSLPEIGAETRALAEKARGRGLELADYEGGTFSISNLGMFGVEEFCAVVNPPQGAILAIGAILDEAVVVDGQVTAGKRCRVTLSCDHRVVYGADAAQFLADLRTVLENPFGLVF